MSPYSSFTPQLPAPSPMIFNYQGCIEQSIENKAEVEFEEKEIISGVIKDNDEVKSIKKKPLITALNFNSIKN